MTITEVPCVTGEQCLVTLPKYYTAPPTAPASPGCVDGQPTTYAPSCQPTSPPTPVVIPPSIPATHTSTAQQSSAPVGGLADTGSNIGLAVTIIVVCLVGGAILVQWARKRAARR